MSKKYKPREKVSLYTVYDNRTDFPICVCEPAERCAQLMSVSLNAFHHYVGSRGSHRWCILRQPPFDEE